MKFRDAMAALQMSSHGRLVSWSIVTRDLWTLPTWLSGSDKVTNVLAGVTRMDSYEKGVHIFRQANTGRKDDHHVYRQSLPGTATGDIIPGHTEERNW